MGLDCGRQRARHTVSVHCENKLVVMTRGLKEVDKTGFSFLLLIVRGHRDYGCDYRGTITHMSLVTNVVGTFGRVIFFMY